MNIAVKAFLTGLVAAGLFSPAVSETRTWTGGGDGTSWTDAANWDEKGAPVSGAGDDIVIDFSAATSDLAMTTGSEPLSIGSLSITPSKNATLTFSGGALTLTRQVADGDDDGFTLKVGSVSDGTGDDLGCKVRILNDIVLPGADGGAYRFVRGYNWNGYNGLELAGVISGPGSAAFHSAGSGQNYILISGNNTYEGGTSIRNTRLRVKTANAFGSVMTVAFAADKIFVELDGSFPYVFDVLPLKSEYFFNMFGAIDWTGGLTGSTITSPQSITAVVASEPQGSDVTVSGDIDLPFCSVKPSAGTKTKLTFTGEINCATVLGHNNENTTNGEKIYLSGGHAVGELQIGMGTHRVNSEDAFKDADLKFMGRWANDNCHLQLNGYSQTFKNIYSAINDSAFNGHSIKSTSAARVTVKPDRDCLAACQLADNVTFAMDAADSGVILTLTNRVHSMNGALVVSNGTLRVNGNATFKNVTALDVAGGTLDLRSSTVAAFSGVTSVTIGKNATLTISETQPFATSGVSVFFEDASGRLDVASGIDLAFDAISVDAVSLDGGTYSGDPTKGVSCEQITGGGTVTLLEQDVQTKDAAWTGGGASADATDLSNWSEGTVLADLTSKGLYPVFAEEGSEAVLGSTVNFKGLVFDIPGGQPTNSFTLTGTGPLSLYGLGVTAADPATDDVYRYAFDVPLRIAKAQTWDVSASGNVSLAVRRPMTGMYPLTKRGAGSLEFHAESPGYAADVVVEGGPVDVYAAKNAFGAPSTGLKINLKSNEQTNVLFRLHGTVIEKPVEWEQQYGKIVAVSGENVFKETILLHSVQKNMRVDVSENAVLRVEGKVEQSWDTGYFSVVKEGPGTLEMASLRCHATAVQVSGGTVRILTANCKRPDGTSTAYQFRGTGRVVFGGANYLNGFWSDVGFYSNNSNNTLDLNGFDQMCGKITADTPRTNGRIYSKTPATLFSFVNGHTDMRNIDIAGAASVVFSSGNAVRTNTIDRAISTFGTLSVSNNVVVVMTENASWLNPTNGTVTVADSARLVLKRANALSRRLDLSLAGNGVLETVGGVAQRCADLYLDDSDEPAACGTWGATGSGAEHIDDRHFAGTGVLTVYGPVRKAMTLILR